MKYTSEYIQKILKSPSAQRAIDYIAPIYANAYAALWLMEVIGEETDLIVNWIDDYLEQVLPQTATWLLPYWEEEYGITPNDALTIEQRRNALLAVIRTRSPINPKKLESIVSLGTGLDVNIIENLTKYSFGVVFNGISGLGYSKKARDIIDRLKPAHLYYDMTGFFRESNKNDNNINISNLTISLNNNNFNSIIYINGKRTLNGEWLLGDFGLRGLKKFKISVSGKNKYGVRTVLTRDNKYRLTNEFLSERTINLSSYKITEEV
jgi:hypothetical protein